MGLNIFISLLQFPEVILFRNDISFKDATNLSKTEKSIIRGLSISIVAVLWFTIFYRIIF